MYWMKSRSYLMVELALLSAGLPIIMLTFGLTKFMLPVLWSVTLYCLFVHWATGGKAIRSDWQWRAVNWQNLAPLLIRFAVCALAITLLTIVQFPDKLFSFVRSNPLFWALVMFLYPVLSVVAQELIYRWFFMRRYQAIFTTQRSLVIASGVAFAIGHIIFNNWVAPLLCLVGGMLFAITYAQKRSLALVVLEHALYGDFVFTIGLGRFFYHGAWN